MPTSLRWYYPDQVPIGVPRSSQNHCESDNLSRSGTPGEYFLATDYVVESRALSVPHRNTLGSGVEALDSVHPDCATLWILPPREHW